MALIKFLRESGATLSLLEQKTWILHSEIGVGRYDFDFSARFDLSHPYALSPGPVIARIGPLANYSDLYDTFAAEGLNFINTVDQYERATDLSCWFDALEDLTPFSRWWSSPPKSSDVEREFHWPVFVKGERQTNRHNAASVVNNAAEFDAFMNAWGADSVLSWQKIVVREFLELRKVTPTSVTNKVPPAFEFRTFWFNGELVGDGPYWSDFAVYNWNSDERQAGIACAQEAVSRIDVPFLVVDIAQTVDGRWVVIELNEAQECGYAGIDPYGVWESVLQRI